MPADDVGQAKPHLRALLRFLRVFQWFNVAYILGLFVVMSGDGSELRTGAAALVWVIGFPGAWFWGAMNERSRHGA